MHYDIIIRNGKIVDGTNSPWFRGDIGINDDIIVKIGNLRNFIAKHEIDAFGKIVSPGFIDTHTHYDMVPFEFAEFLYPFVDDKLLQGVTTVITGCCGNSMAPVTDENKGLWFLRRASRNIERYREVSWNSFKEYQTELGKRSLGTNFASYVGHTTIRFNALGLSNKKPTKADMDIMKNMLRQSLKEGALGMSAGLIYAPAIFSDNGELVELASVLSEFNAPFACHLRNESWDWLEAVKEVIEVAERNGIPGQIHHVKIQNHKNSKELIEEFLKLIYEARERGVDITCDLYPYNAGCTGLEALLLPAWACEGNEMAIIERLANHNLRSKIIEDIYKHRRYKNDEDMYDDCKNILVIIAKNNENLVGETLYDIGMELKMKPLEAAIKLMIDSDVTAMTVNFAMKEDDIKSFLKMPITMIGSDSVPVKLGWSSHPRMFGTFPRIIKKYVKTDKVIDLENAIFKMTGLPATRFRFNDRGFLKEGFKADIVVFDENKICDNATYNEPLATPTGVEYVLVNGCLSVENGKVTGKTAGCVLKRA